MEPRTRLIGDMMNDLNQLLHEWASRKEPAPARLNSLETQIAESFLNVARTPTSESNVIVGRTDVGVRSTAASWTAILAVAASLLAAVTVFWSGHRDESVHPIDVAVNSLPLSDLSARQLLFNELDRMFDGHWRWLGEVNGRVHLQTNEPFVDVGTLNDNSGVAVRLAVVQRRPGETKWSVVWEASVVARTEEWIRLPGELTGDSAVALWAYSLPDGSVLVESDVALTAPVPIRLSEQQVFGTSVRPARLWSTRRADGEFQLIQSIARLESHHG